MNLILLPSSETTQTLAAGTPAAMHLMRVLKARVGTTFWCGAENAARGMATIETISPSGDITFSVAWEQGVPAESFSPPIRLLVGLSRPQTMKKVFATASEIGCREIDVFISQNGDPAYAQSTLWRDGNAEIKEILKKSAEQTCTTLLPRVCFFHSLADALSATGTRDDLSLALDVYEKSSTLPEVLTTEIPAGTLCTLAVGSERGWTNAEREILRERGFKFAHLGARVLRVETAVAVALAVAAAKLGIWREHRQISVNPAERI